MLAYRQLPPTDEEALAARASMRVLARHARDTQPLTVRVIDADQDEPIELPAGAVSLLLDILRAMASGQGITLIPENAELTTMQAADVLNVSRPYLIKLLEQGIIPFHKIGTHRRVRMEDVMHYKAEIDRQRTVMLDELVADAQEQEMGYD